MHQRKHGATPVALLLALLLACVAPAFTQAQSACPSTCPSLPKKQRNASAVAVSMVVFMGCNNDVQGAARAVASSAASGDLDAFTAGLTIGAAVLTSGNDTSRGGQVANLFTNTFNVANAANRTIGVAAAVGGALASMSSSAFTVLANETVTALNNLVTDSSCSMAGTTAIELYLSLKQRSNDKYPLAFVSTARAYGNGCWVRRLNKMVSSNVFQVPLPVNPCTRRMQQASAMAVSLVTASTCRVSTPDAVSAAAVALVTSALKDNCTFASAVATSTMTGLPKAANITNVYTAAITKAGQQKATSQLGNAFAAAAYELNAATGSSAKLLQPLVTATSRTIAVSGCQQALPFVKGMYTRLLALDPAGGAGLATLFQKDSIIAACKFPWSSWK